MTNDELLQIIEQSAEEGWTTLDLSSKGITEIPPEIGKLTKLKELRLVDNQITVTPPEIRNLINLEVLILRHNQIPNFPQLLSEMTFLKVIDLAYNQIITLPSEIGRLVMLTSIYLSHNQLTAIPPTIGNLTNLVSFTCSDNKLSSLPREIGRLEKLASFQLNDNQLITLPSEIGNLVNLRSLRLKNNKLNSLPLEIIKLNNLRELDLTDNPLSDSEISKFINQPIKIFNHYFPQVQIGEIQSNFEDGTYQTGITENDLLQIIEQAAKDDVTSLDLEYKNIMMIPSEIKKLKNLQWLGLSNNQLTILPHEIEELKNLTGISFQYNQLTTFPLSITNLISLRELRLSTNFITELPKEIGKLRNLRELSIRNNKLTELPKEIGNLTNLICLRLADNKLTRLPLEIKNLTTLKELELRGNPLPIPPEILELTDQPQKILNFYFQQGQKKPLNEVKVLIVGQGAVGKTSLIKRLLEDKFDPHETKTDGIAINHWHLTVDDTPIRLNLWDFGGQEIMHATHQFFLTKRSLYVLVLDSRVDEQENRLEYWLKIIQSFGGDSPVIVVCNKSDQHDLDLDWKGLQHKYPIIKAFAKNVSCKTGEGIPQLKTLIEREVAQLEHIHDELILSWFAVKTRLEEMKQDYISYGNYQQMCQEEEVIDELSQQTLLGFLHDLGIVLHFHDHPLLEDTNVLNPEWVTRGVYQILNSYLLFQSKGELDRKMLDRFLDPQLYPRNKHQFIIDMMRKFELCFDFAEFPGERFLVPDLLAKEEPYTGEWVDSLAFQYHYDILPGSVISRFMVRMHAYIHQRTYWRNGVVLASENDKNRALVKADIEDKKIFIYVSGKPETRHIFLEIIRADFRKIHKTIPKLIVKEKVPIPGHPNVVVDYEHLLTLEELGEETFIPEGLRKKVSVRELLHGISGKDATHGQSYGAGTTQLSFVFTQQIIEFLIMIPNIHDKNAQRALIYSAGLDPQLQHQIDFATSAAQFVKGLVPTLVNYGQLQDGRHALTAVLEATKNYFGQDRQTYCETLIQKIQAEFDQTA